MIRTKRNDRWRVNPFYPILVAAGVAFCITAFGYGILALREMRQSRELYSMPVEPAASEQAFMTFMDRNGMGLMAIELAVLATASIFAMVTDRYWSREDD